MCESMTTTNVHLFCFVCPYMVINVSVTSGERLELIREYTKFDYTVGEGKEWLNPSCVKNNASTAERRWRNPV